MRERAEFESVLLIDDACMQHVQTVQLQQLARRNSRLVVDAESGRCTVDSELEPGATAVFSWPTGWGACPDPWPSSGAPPASPLCMWDPRKKVHRKVITGKCGSNQNIQGQPDGQQPDVVCPEGQELKADVTGRTVDSCCVTRAITGFCAGNTAEPDIVCGAGLVLRKNPHTKRKGKDPALIEKNCCKKDRSAGANAEAAASASSPDDNDDDDDDDDDDQPPDIDTASRFALQSTEEAMDEQLIDEEDDGLALETEPL
jgi:hypothetical protein